MTQIDLCVGWRRVAECTSFEFNGVLRHLELGEWQLAGAVDPVKFSDGYTFADVDTIRVVDGKSILFGGYVAPVASGVGSAQIDAHGEGDQFTLTGADLWDVIARRIAYPDPSTEAPWTESHDVRTGKASTAATGYIEANAGSAALSARAIDGLAVVDGLTGATGTWSARLQQLDQLVARVCRDGQITCRFSVDFDGTVTATLGATRDRRYTIVESDQGDITAIQQIAVPAAATYVVAGGQGELTARTFAIRATPQTGAARREQFSDQSSLASASEVGQAAASALAANAASLTVRAQLTDIAASRLVYGDDYLVGDTIAVELNNVRYPTVVESVTFTISAERTVIRPVLGDATPDLVTGLIRDVAGLQTRLNNQIA